MSDVGSIFPLYDSDLEGVESYVVKKNNNNILYYSLCREALGVIAKSLQGTERKVLLPSYTCDTVITPFIEKGWECYYFPVNHKLKIDRTAVLELFSMHRFDLMVVHPYYGVDLDNDEIEMLQYVHSQGCKIVVDLTQCIFSNQRLEFVDYYTGSYRKWFAIPDGAFLETNDESLLSDSELKENETFVSLQTDAMYLRGLYFTTGNEEIKSISRRLNKMAVNKVDANVQPHKMAKVSLKIMATEDLEHNQRQRLDNFQFLFEHLQGIDKCKLLCENMSEITTAPLYFMIFVPDRSQLQATLASHQVYAPLIWPVEYEEVLVNDVVKNIYDTILAIPIDQRYNQSDMSKIVNIIKEYYHE